MKDTIDNNLFPSASCPGKIEVPTERERKALAEMKSIKERVRELKALLAESDIQEGGTDVHEKTELKKEMERLRDEWGKWETERKEAAKERMIALGHEEGP